MLTDCLTPPREEFRLRSLDEPYVAFLKEELLQRPLNFAKPLIGIVKGLEKKDDFSSEEIDRYRIEIVGGNHRRQALAEIKKDHPEIYNSLECMQFANVHLYTGKNSHLTFF